VKAAKGGAIQAANRILERTFLALKRAAETLPCLALLCPRPIYLCAEERIIVALPFYGPVRPGEVELCRHWQAAIREFAPILKVRRNYPYAGKADGLTAHLRRRFPPDEYRGIELEVNQKHVINSGRQ
jgi:hypothetical protein